MRRLMLVAALALGLAACTPDTGGGGVNSTPVAAATDHLMVEATQALIVAENSYTVTASAAATAARAGAIPASLVPTVREINRQANKALDAAGKAQSGAEKLRHVAGLKELTAKLRSFVPIPFLRGGG